MSGDGEFPTKSRRVPEPDGARNYFEEEVTGNKTDAAVITVGTTKSLVAMAKGSLNQLASIITLMGQVIDVHQNVISWCDVDRAARFEISLIDKDSGGIPSGDITEGTYVLSRFREFAIASFADAGLGDVTATTTLAHGFANGETVVISGTTNYDGSYVISNVAANTFDFTDTWVATETGNCGAWQEIVASTAFSKATGLVYLDYVFVNADWATDDIYKVTPTGISVVIGGNTYYPAVTTWLGTIQDVSTIEGKIDVIDTEVGLIQADIGDPSARTNFQTVEAMIGVPDAVNSSLDDIVRTGLNSSAITNNFDGAILEVAKAGLEKDTAGAFNSDTDSNEAISEAIVAAQAAVDEIPSQTNAKTWNATALQSIQDEAEDALEGEDLDHFLKLDGATQKYPENCATDSILAKVLVKADPAVPSQFDNSTDSLEAIRDRMDALNVADQVDLDAIIVGTITNATGVDVATDVVAIQADLDNATDGLGALKIEIDANETKIDTLQSGVDKFKYGAVGSGDINILFPDVDQPLSAIEFSLAELTDDFIADGEITAVGTISIYRYRKGTDAAWTVIVNGVAPAGTAQGSINYSYNFPNASWAIGDMIQVHMTGVQVTVNAQIFTIPRKTVYGVVGTNTLLQDWANGGRLDLLLDAIKAVTDVLPDAGALTSIAQGADLTTHDTAIKARFTGVEGATFATGTDSLEAISDKVALEATVAVVDGLHDVPTQDVATNLQMRDVIGNKTDTHDGTSIMSFLDRLDEHIHSEQKVYPTGAAPVTATSGVGAWTLGSYAEIVPVNTITTQFDLRWIVISEPSGNEDYELVLYAATTEIARIPFTRVAVFDQSVNLPLQTPILPANTQIQAKIMDGTGSLTAKVKLLYHIYN